jgi:ribonuclease HI
LAKKKYYVVWEGRETGIFENWATTQKHTTGHKNARFKSFKTRQEAEEAFAAGDVNQSQKAGPKEQTEKPGISDEYEVSIYCDGSCDPNPGEAGSGLAVYHGQGLVEACYGLYEPNGTNNTAELNALLTALNKASDTIESGATTQILSDSSYSINCITIWAASWEQKAWVRKNNPLKNLDIIQPAYEVYKNIETKVHIAHVSAHTGIEGNEVADRMAMLAITEKEQELTSYNDLKHVSDILKLKSG